MTQVLKDLQHQEDNKGACSSILHTANFIYNLPHLKRKEKEGELTRKIKVVLFLFKDFGDRKVWFRWNIFSCGTKN